MARSCAKGWSRSKRPKRRGETAGGGDLTAWPTAGGGGCGGCTAGDCGKTVVAPTPRGAAAGCGACSSAAGATCALGTLWWGHACAEPDQASIRAAQGAVDEIRIGREREYRRISRPARPV